MQATQPQEERLENDFEFLRLLRSASILVVDDEPGMRNFLKRALEDRCALLEVAGSAEEAEALRLRLHFDVLLVDIRLPGLSGLAWLEKLRERGVRTHVIYMTAYADLDMAIGALRNGADDFIMKPFRTEQMIMAIRRTLTQGQILRENALLRLQLQQMQSDSGLLGESEPFMEMLERLRQLAPAHSCLLIQGESGTGKRLIARQVHAMSRRTGPFVAVSCAALSASDEGQNLFDNEGLIVAANKGTLALLDVDELSLENQALLVHFMDHATLNATQLAPQQRLDVRIVATSNVELLQALDLGTLRRDLYDRLNALSVQVPPLRERGRDLNMLVEAFMQRCATELKLAPVPLLHNDWAHLNAYHWPGNVRELRNLVERTVLLGHLPVDGLDAQTEADTQNIAGYPLTHDLEQVERAHIEAVLASHNNNKSAAARVLGVSRKTLERKQAVWNAQASDD